MSESLTDRPIPHAATSIECNLPTTCNPWHIEDVSSVSCSEMSHPRASALVDQSARRSRIAGSTCSSAPSEELGLACRRRRGRGNKFASLTPLLGMSGDRLMETSQGLGASCSLKRRCVCVVCLVTDEENAFSAISVTQRAL